MLLGVISALLLAGSPELPNTTTETAEKPVEKKVCRKQIETGSLIKGKKICMTAKQWQSVADANRAEVERIASSGSQSGQ